MEETTKNPSDNTPDNLFECFSPFGRGKEEMVRGNLFASGCYMLLQGNEAAGLKIMRMALSALGVSDTKTNRILRYSKKNTKEAALASNPSSELYSLFEN